MLVIGALNILMNGIGLCTEPEYAEQQTRLLFFGIAMFGGGIYLIKRAKSKRQEQEDRDKWAGK